MKKTLIATSVATSLITISQPVFADESAAPADENILVTANRSAQNSFEVLASHEIIAEADIKLIQAQNLGDILKSIAGISVMSQGGTGQQKSVFTRGTNSGHTLLIIDGIRVGSASLGSPNYASIPTNQIERIEVVKGPRAALWGSDAIGGVIQIFTKRYEAGEGLVSLGLGSNGYQQANASVGLGNEQHSLTVSVNKEEADGFDVFQPENNMQKDDDGYERTSVSLVLSSNLNEDAKLDVVALYQDGNSEYDSDWSADESDYENHQLSASLAYSVNDALMTTLTLGTNQDKSVTFGNGTQRGFIQTERDELSFLTNYQAIPELAINTGIDAYTESVSSSDLSAYSEGIQQYENDERDLIGIFIQSTYERNEWLIEGAVRYEDIEKVDEEVTYNLSLGYKLSENSLVAFNRGTGFKAPTFNSLYWPGSGNSDLKPEESETNEILFRHNLEQGELELAVYESDIENLVEWSPHSGTWLPYNVSPEIKGLEAVLNYTTGDFNHIVAYSYVKTEVTFGEFTRELLRRPRTEVSYTLGYEFDQLDINSTVNYRGDSFDMEGSEVIELSSAVTVDLSVKYAMTESLSAAVKADNLFDEDYQSANNYPAEGQSFKLNVEYLF